MAFETILVEKQDGIATLTLNRPERLNALNMTMLREVRSVMRGMEDDTDTRVIVVTGKGRAFTSGIDLKGDSEVRANLVFAPPYNFVKFYLTVVKDVMCGLQTLKVPVIAMMNGPAIGVGFDLAMACDIRIGCEHTLMNVGYPRRGIIPAGGGLWFLPRLVGMGRAAELILTSRDISPEEGERIGILNKMVPSERLEEETMAMARRLARGATIALHLCKVNLYHNMHQDLSMAMDAFAAYQTVAFGTEDTKEAWTAYLEKREPVFRAR